MAAAPDKRPILKAGRARTSHEHVVNELGQAIVGGHFAIGSVLPGDSELMSRFGVSRTVLREGMKTLVAKGLVRPKAKIGTRVLDRDNWNMFDPQMLAWHLDLGIDDGFLTHIAEMRLALEPAAAALAAERRSETDLETLYRLVELLGQPDHTRESFADADLQLHLAIADAARNPFMRSIGSLTEAAFTVALKLSSPAEDPERVRGSAAEHRAIVDAIRDGDADAARQAMIFVIRAGVTRVRGAIPEER